uniref:Uncharacterized protein n=1 Tax=Siphoviridae sp. ctCb814 TaxID=2827808 RepID=A0A8S5SPA8_9CAUD|nr:MAG TPA: hypothetical protein [Siphoviridae sp. ctCb814]
MAEWYVDPEAFARGYNELSKSIEAAWGEESEEKHGGVVR